MSHPTVPVSALSESAQRLYGSGHSSLVLDRDWLEPGAHRMSEHAFRPELRLDPGFRPGDELLAAVAELVEAGYAWHSHGDSYGLRHVDQELYTVASGSGPWLIEVSRVGRPGLVPGQEASRSPPGTPLRPNGNTTLASSSSSICDVQTSTESARGSDDCHGLISPAFAGVAKAGFSCW